MMYAPARFRASRIISLVPATPRVLGFRAFLSGLKGALSIGYPLSTSSNSIQWLKKLSSTRGQEAQVSPACVHLPSLSHYAPRQTICREKDFHSLPFPPACLLSRTFTAILPRFITTHFIPFPLGHCKRWHFYDGCISLSLYRAAQEYYPVRPPQCRPLPWSEIASRWMLVNQMFTASQ